MKKSLIALLALAGVAMGGVQQNADGTLQSTGGNYVYSWQNAEWKYLPSDKTTGDLEGPKNTYTPGSWGDTAIYGYSYDASSGKFTPTTNSITNVPVLGQGAAHLYLSGDITATIGDFGANQTVHLAHNTTLTMGCDVGLKNNLTLDYGNMTTSSSLVEHTANTIWMSGNSSLTLSGTYTVESGKLFEKTIFTTIGEYSGGSLTLNNITNSFTVVTVNGVELENIGVISDASALKSGQSAIVWSEDKATLVAMMVPEPTTATLSLLALAGLAARRRRR